MMDENKTATGAVSADMPEQPESPLEQAPEQPVRAVYQGLLIREVEVAPEPPEPKECLPLQELDIPPVREESLSLAQVETPQPAKIEPDRRKQSGREERRGAKRLLWDIFSVIISAVVIAFVLKTFVVDSRIVPSGSMIPTIQEGDRVIITKLQFFLGATPGFQDVVVFTAGEELGNEDLLKRVIGLPGDTVEVKDGRVYVNGETFDEPYINEPPVKDYGPVTVPEGCYFMLGDNRNRSKDSRMWKEPFVPLSDIKGKVVVCYWPFKHIGLVE